MLCSPERICGSSFNGCLVTNLTMKVPSGSDPFHFDSIQLLRFKTVELQKKDQTDVAPELRSKWYPVRVDPGTRDPALCVAGQILPTSWSVEQSLKPAGKVENEGCIPLALEWLFFFPGLRCNVTLGVV